MPKVYGIDLGTTYSVIATLDDRGMPEIIENHDDGMPTLASAVYFQANGTPVVGEVAKAQSVIEPGRVVQFVKRQIGKPDAQVFEFDGYKYDPITISALFLKRMKEYAEAQGHSVEQVVITCPAYFGNEERAATRQAGVIAGLNVLNIVNEPTAAALNYCCREFRENRKIMVYDLGGGTFDVTLMDLTVDDSGKATVDVVDSSGDDKLGGIDWDARLYDYICKLYCDENGFTVDQVDNELRAAIQGQVEGIKKLLSRTATRSFSVSYAGDVSRLEVSAAKFEELTQDLVMRTMDFVHQLLSNNSLTPSHIDVVLLVGGSTKMPMIKKAVEGLFPSKVRVEDPDLAVAKGAALYAALVVNENLRKRVRGQVDEFGTTGDSESGSDILPPLTEQQASALRIHVAQQIDAGIGRLSRSFGPAVFVDDSRYMIDNLLFVGDESPAEATATYGPRADNQAAIEFTVFENVAKDRVNRHITPSVDENGEDRYTDPALKVKPLGNVRLELPPRTPRGTSIEVSFRCSALGLEVRATNLKTGDSVKAVMTSENTKTQEELNEATKHMASIRTRSDF